MMYIWAWQAAPLPPARWISSRIAAAADKRQAGAAILLGNQRREIAGIGERLDEFARIGGVAIELAPVLRREGGAQLAHLLADIGVRIGVGRLDGIDVHPSQVASVQRSSANGLGTSSAVLIHTLLVCRYSSIASLAVLAAEAAVLVAAERRHEADGAVGVDPDRAGAQPLAHLDGAADIGRPHAGGEAVDRVVGDRHRLLVVVEAG